MATPNIQNEPAAVEGFDATREPPEERHPIVPPDLHPFDIGLLVKTFEGAEPGRYLVDAFDADGTERGPTVVVLHPDGTQTREDLRPEDEPYVEMEHAPEEAIRLPDRPLTAAERRAIRGPREPKKPRLRRDLFGSAGGVK